MERHLRQISAAISLAALLALGATRVMAQGGYRFTTVDDPLGVPCVDILAGDGPFGVNSSGVIVGVYFDSAGRSHGYVYRSGIFTTVDHPNAGSSAGQGTFLVSINNRGVIGGTYTDAN